MPPILRSILMLISGAIMLFLMVTVGLVVLGVFIVFGISVLIYFKLRGKEIINPIDQMGMGHSQQSEDPTTIEAEYEVVSEEDTISERQKAEEK